MPDSRDHVRAVLPKTLHILPVDDVLFPCGIVTHIARDPWEIEVIESALQGDWLIGAVQRQEGKPSAADKAFYKTGCLGSIKQVTDREDGSFEVKLRGLLRFNVDPKPLASSPCSPCEIDFSPFMHDVLDEKEAGVDRQALLNTLDRYLTAYPQRIDWDAIHEADTDIIVNGLAMQAPFSRAEKQALLEAGSLKARSDLLVSLFEFETTKVLGPP